MGCGLNRKVHCVLYLFILSAGGRPDPPWPTVRAVGRDGENGRRKACREISQHVCVNVRMHFDYISKRKKNDQGVNILMSSFTFNACCVFKFSMMANNKSV